MSYGAPRTDKQLNETFYAQPQVDSYESQYDISSTTIIITIKIIIIG
jgi:hypothetical protein